MFHPPFPEHDRPSDLTRLTSRRVKDYTRQQSITSLLENPLDDLSSTSSTLRWTSSSVYQTSTRRLIFHSSQSACTPTCLFIAKLKPLHHTWTKSTIKCAMMPSWVKLPSNEENSFHQENSHNIPHIFGVYIAYKNNHVSTGSWIILIRSVLLSVIKDERTNRLYTVITVSFKHANLIPISGWCKNQL